MLQTKMRAIPDVGDRKPEVLKLVEKQTGKSYGERKGGKYRIVDHSETP